jgi:hypothetical protein
MRVNGVVLMKQQSVVFPASYFVSWQKISIFRIPHRFCRLGCQIWGVRVLFSRSTVALASWPPGLPSRGWMGRVAPDKKRARRLTTFRRPSSARQLIKAVR